MGGVTNGLLNTTVVEDPNVSTFSFYGKPGLDRQVSEDLRVRLMASAYGNSDAGRSTLYGGDRAGSRYYYALENTLATSAGNAFSGTLNPGFSKEVMAVQVNPFVKFGGSSSSGCTSAPRAARSWRRRTSAARGPSTPVDGVYRFLPQEQAYVGVRYNRAEGPLAGPAISGQITTAGNDVSITRYATSAGWFVTRNLLAKLEYVQQSYDGFAPTDIRNGGEFKGFVFEGVITF